MFLEKLFLIFGGQVPILRNPPVMIMSDKVVDILLEIRPGTADRMNLPLTDHFGEGKPQFCRAHGPGQSDKHPTPACNVFTIGNRSILHDRGIEMPVMPINKFRNRSF
jgi:hypothetical protein